MTINTFKKRIKQGRSAEKRCIEFLEKYGFRIVKTGQENLDKDLKHLRHNRTLTSEFARHIPDILCSLDDKEPFYVEIKSTSKKYWDRDNFSIETASLDICQLLTKAGIKVAIVWENKPNEFFMEWAQIINPFVRGYDVKKSAGSRTPYSLIDKCDILTINEFLENTKDDTEEIDYGDL